MKTKINKARQIPFSPEAVNADKKARISFSLAPVLLFLQAMLAHQICFNSDLCNSIFADPSSIRSKLTIIMVVILMGIVACGPAVYFTWKRSKLIQRDMQQNKYT